METLALTRRKGLSLLLLLPLLALLSQAIRAHPDGAPPIRHPLVVGFERFYAEGDPPDYLASGGLLLLGELNCTACHAPPKAWREVLAGRPGRGLARVGERLSFEEIWLAIRHPPALRRGSRMPAFFAHASREEEEIDAIASFLAGLGRKTESAGDFPAGEVAAGRRVFHEVGCIACHAPEVPEGGERPNVHSLALSLAERYEPAGLARLLGGKEEHPHPDFRLSEKEIRDLVTYLQDPQPGERKALPVTGVRTPSLGPRGKALIAAKGCAACHGIEVPRENEVPVRAARSGRPLLELEVGAGCLAPDSLPGAPFWGLSDLQREALGAALARISGDSQATAWTVEEALDLRISKENCYACHSWREKGGLEEARAAFWNPRVEIPDLGAWEDPFAVPCPLRMSP